MNEENSFWLTIWRSAAITLSIFIACCFVSCQVETYAISKAIEAGVNPMLAKCAINGLGDGGRNGVICRDALDHK